ncbi:hypothetical protein PENTCL1PPCAC_16467, partial [Pristionchus entomophagus]
TLPEYWNNATGRENCTALNNKANKTIGHWIFVHAQLLYVIPTMIYVKFLLVALLCGKNRKSRYTSIFYSFITMGALTAVLIHLPRSIFEIIGKHEHIFCPTFRALSQPSYLLDIYVYIMQVWDTLRILAGTMIVLYRFHSLIDIFAAKRFWETKKTAILLVTIAVPMVAFLPIFLTPAHAAIDDEEMIFENVGLIWFNESAVHCFICVVCTIVVLATTAILLKRGTTNDPQIDTRAGQQPDLASTKLVGESVPRALDIVGLVEIVVITLYSLCYCARFAREHFGRILPPRILYGSLLVSDALGFCPPWALYFVSHYIRQDATPFRSLFIRCCKSRQTENPHEMKQRSGQNRETIESVE